MKSDASYPATFIPTWLAWCVAPPLNLMVAFGPAWAFGWLTIAQAPQFATLAAGLTCLLLSEVAARSPHTVMRVAYTPDDRRAIRLATVVGLGLVATIWTALGECAMTDDVATYGRLAVGGLLMATGALFRGLALRQLGSRFRTEVSPVPDDRLVRDGIYSRLRHPSEAGLLLAITGVLCTLGAWRTSSVAVPVFALLMIARLALEERALAARFGDDYARYRRAVPALWPRLHGVLLRST